MTLNKLSKHSKLSIPPWKDNKAMSTPSIVTTSTKDSAIENTLGTNQASTRQQRTPHIHFEELKDFNENEENSINNLKFGKKEQNETTTHPTIEVESISDLNWEDSSNKTTLKKSENIEENVKDSPENKQEIDNMTGFLKEINSFNSKLVSRRKQIYAQIEILDNQLSLLESIKNTPQEMAEYIIQQRKLRVMIYKALKIGKYPSNDSSLKYIEPLSKYIDKIKNSTEKDLIAGPFKKVFITEKTEGYRKEMEMQDSDELEKKRNIKGFHKENNCGIEMLEIDPLQGNFETPFNDFYNQGGPFNYPSSRGMYEFEQHPFGMYNGSEELERTPHNPYLAEQSHQNNNIFPPELPFCENLPFSPEQKWGEKEAENVIFNGDPNDILQNDVLGDILEEKCADSLFDSIKIKEESAERTDIFGDLSEKEDVIEDIPQETNSQAYLRGQVLNDSGAKINNHILDNFSDSDVNLDCIPLAEGNHQMNLSESNSNMAPKQPLFVGPSTELNTPAFPQQSMCDQYMNNPTFAPSNPIYDM